VSEIVPATAMILTNAERRIDARIPPATFFLDCPLFFWISRGMLATFSA
jgi:hypothetical protein